MNDASANAARLNQIIHDYQQFRKYVVPLCAAETPLSDYVRSFMASPIQEQYAMGGPLVPQLENFVGAIHVLDLHDLTIDLCNQVFGARYADPRPLSGTGAITNLLMTLSSPGQRVLLQGPASGGHASMGPICRRLGLDVVELPFDYDRFQIDSGACVALAKDPFDFVLYAPSDILYPPKFEELGFADKTTVIYDATQTLGLIATGHLPNPLSAHSRLVIAGGTHKTLPGPSSGLLMTNNKQIAAQLDTELSPKFVRHSHPHHMAALCATLIEHSMIGRKYSDRIRLYVQLLSAALEERDITVLQDDNRHSETHQVFVHVEASNLDAAYLRASAAGITLNAKRKRLFRGSGLRLGVQEIARYQWGPNDLTELADLLAQVLVGTEPVDSLRNKVRRLSRLNTFADEMQIRQLS